MDKKRELLIATGVAFLFALKKAFIWDYGFNPDLGLEFSSILKIVQGETVYKDFVWIYGPFCLYYYVLLYKIFGILGIYVIKANIALFGTLGCFFAYKAARLALEPFWAGVAALLAFSSLIAPVHVSGHIFSIVSFVVTFYLILCYVKHDRSQVLVWAGLICGFSLLNKPIHYGMGSVLGGLTAIFFTDLFFKREKFKNSRVFLLSAAVIPLLVYSTLLFFVPLQNLFMNLFPMFSGYFNKVSTFLYMKDIFPFGIFDVKSFGDFKNVLNIYIGDSMRWWLIWIMALLGAVKVAMMWREERKITRQQIVLFTIVVHSLLLEFQVLVVPHQFASYVNMLPTYILLCYFASVGLKSRVLKSGLVLFIGLWFGLFFIYSPLNHYLYFKKHGVPFSQKYGGKIITTHYKDHLYDTLSRLIHQRTAAADTILVADFDPFIYVFSQRKSLFPENDILFLKTSFHPYNWGENKLGNSTGFFDRVENEIIRKVKANKPKMILVPTKYLADSKIENSPFLQYLLENWRAVAEVGDKTMIGPFDGNKNITVFEKSIPPLRAEKTSG